MMTALVPAMLLIAGLLLIVFGADWLVDGASVIARKAGVSEFVIGLVIVGFGTSCPEFVVSATGAIAGNSDISVGNVIGSNIFNTLLILGLTAVIAPLAITSENRRRDIPLCIGITVLFCLLGLKQTLFHIGVDGLSRIEGALLLVIFAIYIYSCFRNNKTDEPEQADAKKIGTWGGVLYVLAGLAGLIAGGKLFVGGATDIAKLIGVSDKFIAITILAGGTSLPELATCVVAAAKKKGQLALGNILGSNVFNILLILGSAALIHPISFENINFVDMGVLLLSSILIFTSSFFGRRNTIDRFDGAILLLCEAAYMTWLIMSI